MRPAPVYDPGVTSGTQPELASARERIEQLAKRSGFEGRLVILAEPEIATGDCRIEWADGGVVLERAAIETKINELVGRYMASRGQAGGTGAGVAIHGERVTGLQDSVDGQQHGGRRPVLAQRDQAGGQPRRPAE